MIRLFFGKEFERKISEGIIEKSSKLIVEKLPPLNKANILEESKLAIENKKLIIEEAKLSLEEKKLTASYDFANMAAKATKKGAWIRAGAAITSTGIAGFLAYFYFKPIEEKSKMHRQENEELKDMLFTYVLDSKEEKEALERAEALLSKHSKEYLEYKKERIRIKSKYDDERKKAKLPLLSTNTSSDPSMKEENSVESKPNTPKNGS